MSFEGLKNIRICILVYIQGKEENPKQMCDTRCIRRQDNGHNSQKSATAYPVTCFSFLWCPESTHFFPDNRMDAATKSRTSEDILRSTRLSTYSPEPYSQSECDYYPYASSPKGSNLLQY